MQLSETIKLYPAREQNRLIVSSMKAYIDTVNALVEHSLNIEPITRFSSANVDAQLPAAVKNQCIRDAKAIIRKYNKAVRKAEWFRAHGKEAKEPSLPVLRRPCMYINNQNFRIRDDCIEFPLWIDGRSKRVSICFSITKRQREILCAGAHLGTLRIVQKDRFLAAQVTYDVPEEESRAGDVVLGVDLGIKCPAVSYDSNGKVRFYGNGRKNKYMRRHYAYLRKKLQQKKKLSVVKRINHKEQHIMRDIDHKLSRQIVNEAVRINASVIKLEELSNIRNTTRQSRKNNHSLHTWSFYRLAQFIDYKARLVGIPVVYVEPAFTSRTCPVCGEHNHAEDRHYVCACGFHAHRDIVGARNICASTEYVGVSAPDRRTA